jgi:hypothetical protein
MAFNGIQWHLMAAHLKVLNDWRFAIQRVYERLPFVAIQRPSGANAILLR